MSIIKSFDFIAALSPALRQAIDQGQSDPHRWKIVDRKLIDGKTGTRWYEDDESDEEIENKIIERWIKNIECFQLIPGKDFKKLIESYRDKWKELKFESIENLNISNIHDSCEDYHTLWACNQMANIIKDNNIQLNQHPDRHDSGILIIYGMGSSQSISKIIGITKPRIVLIFEDNLDIICSRLNRHTAAEALLHATQANQSTLFFITDTDADLAIGNAKAIIEKVSLRAQSYCFSIAFNNSKSLELINEELLNKDAYAKSLRYLGFFTDELHMLMNGILTFSHTDSEIIQSKNIVRTKRHAVVVASGPSLKAELPRLKKSRDCYDLFCAFSTLGTLLNEKIVPDYHCHIERHYDKNFVQSTEKLREFCRNGILLTSANVDPRLAILYKKVYAILRSGSSSTALHVENPDDIVYSEGTNAGTFAVTVAILLGYDTIHIFGLDLGATDRSNLRMKDALNKSIRNMDIKVRGNLRESVWTDQFLLDSATILGTFLDPKIPNSKLSRDRASEIRVYNYSDGQKIPQTVSSTPSSFEKNLEPSQSEPYIYLSKVKEKNKSKNFKVTSKLIAANLQSKIKLQCQIMRELSKSPLNDRALDLYLQSCTDKTSSFLNKTSHSDQILARLLGGSISRIWIFISIISRYVPNQNKAMWEKASVRILHSCIDSIEKMSIEMIQYSLSIDNLEDHKLQSIYPERNDKL